MSAIRFIGKLFLKTIAVVLFIPAWIFNLFLKLFAVIYAYIAPVFCLGFAVVGIVMLLRGSTEPYIWKMLVGAAVGYGLTFIFPYVTVGMDRFLNKTKDFIGDPLIVRSPVKYTL